MKIDIAGPMIGAHVEGLDTYTPVVKGQELQLECGSVQATLANLNRLTDTSSARIQRQVVSIYAIDGRILIVFDTGESYLATGFTLESNEPETTELAMFAAKHKLGLSKRECLNRCQRLPANHTGPVFPLPMNAVPRDDDSVHISTGDTQTLPIRP